MSNPFQPRAVRSRRGAPAKPALSQDAIVSAALGLLVREGPEGMSLRKVASALDTGAASLYAYVEGLEELQALVCDRGLSAVKTARSRKLGWREQLVALLDSYLLVLLGTPGLAQLALKTIAIGPNALRILEAQLALLAAGGIDRGTAAWASDLLLLYVTAIAAEQTERRKRSDPLGPVARVMETISGADYPSIFAAREELLSGGPSRARWAIDVLLEGIRKTPRPAGTAIQKQRPEKKMTGKQATGKHAVLKKTSAPKRKTLGDLKNEK
jgi:AcrR family transcriptional regulator